MKLKHRIKIAWNLLFSSKYIDDLNNKAKEANDNYIEAADSFTKTLQLFQEKPRKRFVTHPSMKDRRTITYIPSPARRPMLPIDHTSTVQAEIYTLNHAKSIFKTSKEMQSHIKNQVSEEIAEYFFNNGFVEMRFVDGDRDIPGMLTCEAKVYYCE